MAPSGFCFPRSRLCVPQTACESHASVKGNVPPITSICPVLTTLHVKELWGAPIPGEVGYHFIHIKDGRVRI